MPYEVWMCFTTFEISAPLENGTNKNRTCVSNSVKCGKTATENFEILKK